MASSLTGTSNTVGLTKVNVQQLIDYAYRDVGRYAEEITPEYVLAAKQALFYLLMNLSNKGVNLWLLKYVLVGGMRNTREVYMPVGTVDVLEANYRSQTPATPNQNPNNIFSVQTITPAVNYTIAAGASLPATFTPATPLLNVGFYSESDNDQLILEYSIDGVIWAQYGTIIKNVPQNKWGYIQIDSSPNVSYWRLRNATTSPITVFAVNMSNVQQDIPFARLNRDNYFNLPNKDFVSNRALQYWFDRQLTPIMNIWPVPQDDTQIFQLVLEYQMYDVGTLTNQIAVPDRWLPYIQAKLSHLLSLQLHGTDLNKIVYLENMARELFLDASDEDRDRSPIYFQPNISYYTR